MPRLFVLLWFAWLRAPLGISTTAQVSAKDLGQVAGLSLEDRCAMAAIAASQVANLSEFVAIQREPRLESNDAPGPKATFDVFISQYSSDRRELPISIFGRGESCPSLSVVRRYSSGPPTVVTFAAGSREDLIEGRTYRLLWTKRRGPRRWELSWRYANSTWACPKAKPPSPTVCANPPSPMVPQPILRVAIRKDPDGVIIMESSELELDNPKPVLRPAGGASPVSGSKAPPAP
jgi:hypothetical protein